MTWRTSPTPATEVVGIGLLSSTGFEVAQLDRYLGRICFSKENAAIQTNLLT